MQAPARHIRQLRCTQPGPAAAPRTLTQARHQLRGQGALQLGLPACAQRPGSAFGWRLLWHLQGRCGARLCCSKPSLTATARRPRGAQAPQHCKAWGPALPAQQLFEGLQFMLAKTLLPAAAARSLHGLLTAWHLRPGGQGMAGSTCAGCWRRPCSGHTRCLRVTAQAWEGLGMVKPCQAGCCTGAPRAMLTGHKRPAIVRARPDLGNLVWPVRRTVLAGPGAHSRQAPTWPDGIQHSRRLGHHCLGPAPAQRTVHGAAAAADSVLVHLPL